MPVFLTVQKLLADKTLGEVSAYEAHFDRFRPAVRQRWREDAGLGGGFGTIWLLIY
ncbi:oxidoreductase [Proteus mirabilis]|uniref:Oxidoreductase n=1 Tax=Proteus mirabilis TaxID=584 RepID=A0A2X2DS59_PROMI|nr:oxidoreductase [Proteus mirabilis]